MRKALVGVKRSIDYAVKIRVKPDQSGVVTQGIKMSMNPFDEIAVTEAVALKKKGFVDEIVVVGVGSKDYQEILRRAMAMGADRGIHVQTDESLDVQPRLVAQAFRELAKKEQPVVVLMGKQAIDDDCNVTGQMLAAQLGWPQATFASSITVSADKNSLTVDREVDNGLQTVTVQVPAVVTCDLRLNEPVYAKLPEIMKAKKKPMDTMSPADLGLDPTPQLSTVRVTDPPTRAAGRKVHDVTDLLSALKADGLLE